jgi:hypothetical protein
MTFPIDTEITASGDTLMRQAMMTAAEYFDDAVRSIDAEFGAGYAKQNPALVAAYMQTAAADFATTSMGQQIRAGLDHIGTLERTLVLALRSTTVSGRMKGIFTFTTNGICNRQRTTNKRPRCGGRLQRGCQNVSAACQGPPETQAIKENLMAEDKHTTPLPSQPMPKNKIHSKEQTPLPVPVAAAGLPAPMQCTQLNDELSTLAAKCCPPGYHPYLGPTAQCLQKVDVAYGRQALAGLAALQQRWHAMERPATAVEIAATVLRLLSCCPLAKNIDPAILTDELSEILAEAKLSVFVLERLKRGLIRDGCWLPVKNLGARIEREQLKARKYALLQQDLPALISQAAEMQGVEDGAKEAAEYAHVRRAQDALFKRLRNPDGSIDGDKYFEMIDPKWGAQDE